MSNRYGNYPGEDNRPFYQGAEQQNFPVQPGYPGYQGEYPSAMAHQYPGQPQYHGQPMYHVGQQPQAPAKSWVVTLLLCFFLGTLGVHNFYLGYTRRGISQVLLSVGGWILNLTLVGIIIGAPMLLVVGVWVFIEFFMILFRSGSMAKDSAGVPLN